MAGHVYTGFHAVEERLRRYVQEKEGGSPLLYYCKPGPRVKKILSLAREAGISPLASDEKTLDGLVQVLPVPAREHRGLVLVMPEDDVRRQVVDVEDWLSRCPEQATVLMLDGVTDPHNVGAIIRSCDQFGAGLLIVPERRSVSDVQENEVIARTSAGASAYLPVAVVTNLVRTAEQLKEAGFWLYGADAGGQALGKTALAARTCIIMGSEGSGISRLLAKQCDTMLSIPTCGHIDSLNVSVAAGVLLYERYRQQCASHSEH